MNDTDLSNKTFLTIKEVANRYGISRGTVYRWIEVGSLPKPHWLCTSMLLFDLDELIQWEEKQPRLDCSTS